MEKNNIDISNLEKDLIFKIIKKGNKLSGFHFGISKINGLLYFNCYYEKAEYLGEIFYIEQRSNPLWSTLQMLNVDNLSYLYKAVCELVELETRNE